MVELAIRRNVYAVPLSEIDWTPGLRPIDPVWVEGLRALIRTSGQREAIKVSRQPSGRFTIVKGRHRFRAVEAEGLPEIDAEIFEGSDLDRREEEVAENLHRGGLAPLDRAAFVAEAIEIAKARAGIDPAESAQKLAAEARWSKRVGIEADDASRIVRLAFGMADDVAEKIGLSRASIYRDLELHRGLQADLVEAVRGLPIGGNAAQLRALAKLDAKSQAEAVALLQEGQAKSVSDAVGILKQKPLPDPAKKAWSAVVGNWARLSAADQKAVLRVLKLPKGVVLTIDGEPV